MKIFINGRFLTQSITGVQRYAHEIVKEIDVLLDLPEFNKLEVVILTPKNICRSMNLKNIEIVSKGLLKGHLWEQIELPCFSMKGSLINLCNVAPMFKRNQLVVIHDVSVFNQNDDFSFLFRTWYKLIFQLETRLSKGIITVSKFSKDEILKYISINNEKVHVYLEGSEHIKNRSADYSIIEKHSLGTRPYILAVGSMDPRKNFKNLVQAFENLGDINADIVIAGGTNPRVFKNKSISFSSNVKYLGYVSDNQLKALYEKAYCFVYPSFYEGFGLPPLEAMSVGCPVIVSNVASLPEVCGSNAIYCDPNDVNDIAEKIAYIVENPEIREKYKIKAIEHSSNFTWKESALGIMDQLLEV